MKGKELYVLVNKETDRTLSHSSPVDNMFWIMSYW